MPHITQIFPEVNEEYGEAEYAEIRQDYLATLNKCPRLNTDTCEYQELLKDYDIHNNDTDLDYDDVNEEPEVESSNEVGDSIPSSSRTTRLILIFTYFIKSKNMSTE